MPHRFATTPTRDDLRDRLRRVIAEQFDIDPDHLAPGTVISRLGADSVGALELTMAVEDAFDIEIEDAALDRLHTLEEVTRYLAERLGV